MNTIRLLDIINMFYIAVQAVVQHPPVQPSQLPEQLSSQLPEHPEEQLPLQLFPQPMLLPPPLPGFSSGSSFEQDVRMDGPNRLMPKMGSAPLAVFFKNSLRDWSSSFFSFFVMTLEMFKMPMNSPIQR